MPGENIMTAIFDKHPDLKTLSPRHLRAVKEAIREAIAFSSREILTENETDAFFKKLAPDSGKPSAALRAYRKRQSLTQKALAKTSGIPVSHISAMEKGKKAIAPAMARKLAMPLNVHYKKLI